MSVIDDLKRLERIGSEMSKTTAKLILSASNIADLLVTILPKDELLPREYSVTRETLLIKIDGERTRIMNGVRSGRREALMFAEDIATGLLSELASFLATRKEADEKTIDLLQITEEAIKCIK